MSGHKTNWDALLDEMLEDAEFARLYEEAGRKWDLVLQIGRLRAETNMTQEDLAQRAGTSRQLISRLENGDCTRVNINTLSRIAGALGAAVIVGLVPRRDADETGARASGAASRV